MEAQTPQKTEAEPERWDNHPPVTLLQIQAASADKVGRDKHDGDDKYSSEEDGRGNKVEKKKGPRARFSDGESVFLCIDGKRYGPYRAYIVGNDTFHLVDEAGNAINQGEVFSADYLEAVQKRTQKKK